MSRQFRMLTPFLSFLLAIAAMAPIGQSDEGMWAFNHLPRQQLKAKYDFEPTDAWVNHVMKSAVRFNSGGSGSFVSSTGLVLTNHHVGADTLHKVSTAGNDYYRQGFRARTQADEPKAPDLELNVLQSIEDVTTRVTAAVKPEMTPAAAFAARQAVIATIEQESLQKTGLRSDVVTLYQGGQYHLYRYKKYTDIRLVWAPEFAIAFFGGDPDNFEYPRYDLDVCLFRAYENDQPAKIEHFLKWSKAGAADNELVFVAGHPGRTDRLNTMAALKFNRDIRLPYILDWLRREEIMLQQYSQDGEESYRIGKEDLFGVQNSRKALLGQLAGLQDAGILAPKAKAEEALRARVAADPRLKAEYGSAWQRIEQAKQVQTELLQEYSVLETRQGIGGALFSIARTLVRLAAENEKPNTQRLREFSDSARSSLVLQLYSSAPIYDDLELAKLTDSLGYLTEKLGADSPLVQAILAGKGPAARAADLIAGTKLKAVAERERLAKGGTAAIESSTDPLIQLARLLDPAARAIRKKYEEQVVEVERQAYGQIARVLFEVEGPDRYPDATFTLRLSFGTVKGYLENGQRIPPWTTMGGAFDHAARHGNRDAWVLPESWHQHRSKIAAATPYNFVSTCDIIGGNSGSPVINRAGEFVGIIFDGNVQSLIGNFVYDETQNRAVSVHSSSIIEALTNIYDAADLAQELGK
ncbi:MAG: S46 family peptidase [Planctomycetes bacterium]|nr:S46 family peptidase [Planctomycetota bacterium]